jgi:uncharacterized membrane protein YfcA
VSTTELIILVPIVFVVAGVYAAVGLGGGTGYLAVMALLGMPAQEMAPTALFLNFMVTAAASVRYGWQHFKGGVSAQGKPSSEPRWRLFWPFLVVAAPMALAASFVRANEAAFMGILGVALVLAGIFTMRSARAELALAAEPDRLRHWSIATVSGGTIGGLAGFVGIGGGVFLGPLLLALRWATIREVTSFGTVFVLVLSAMGLIGHGIGGALNLGTVLPLTLAALVGGYVGIRLAEGSLSPVTVQRILGGVVLLAGAKACYDALLR